MMQHPAALAIAGALLAIALCSACGGGGGGGRTATAERSPAGDATALATATATPGLGIRTLDLSNAPDVLAITAATGGSYAPSQVIYADLTGDGVDEALVPISSGGTLGDVAFLVLSPYGGETKTLLREVPLGGGGLAVDVVGGQVVMTQPLYAAEDPNCCPSMLRTTTYVWNGTSFAVRSIQTAANPAGGGKPTPGP